MGTAHKPKSTGARRARSVKPSRKSRRKPMCPPIPDLHSILGRFYSALALVAVAHTAIHASDELGEEECVLRQGIAGLNAVYDEFDLADCKLFRLRKSVGTAAGDET
jgi:hypothetical protein